MKVNEIKAKVAAKVAKGKDKIEKKCGKVKACIVWIVATAALAAINGCATADAPTAQRAQTVTVTDNTFNFNIGQCEQSVTNHTAVVPSFHFEFGTAAQANETSGTETMSATNTQTPTTDVKPQTTLTYGLASSTPAGAKWIDSLDKDCAKLLSSWIGTGKANGTMEVTKKDGTTETVTCTDGICTTSTGERITCDECSL